MSETPYIVLGTCLLVVAVGLLLALSVILYRKYYGYYSPGLVPHDTKIRPEYGIHKNRVHKKKKIVPITSFTEFEKVLKMNTANPALNDMDKDQAAEQLKNLKKMRTKHLQAIEGVDHIDEFKNRHSMERGVLTTMLQKRQADLEKSMNDIWAKFPPDDGGGLAGGMDGYGGGMVESIDITNNPVVPFDNPPAITHDQAVANLIAFATPNQAPPAATLANGGVTVNPPNENTNNLPVVTVNLGDNHTATVADRPKTTAGRASKHYRKGILNRAQSKRSERVTRMNRSTPTHLYFYEGKQMDNTRRDSKRRVNDLLNTLAYETRFGLKTQEEAADKFNSHFNFMNKAR